MYDTNLLTSKTMEFVLISDYKLGFEFLSESCLKNLYNKSWTYDQIFFRNNPILNEKTLATLPPTSPLKVQQVYIKNNINNEIGQQNPR